MKKIFLVAVVALLATPLFASDMKFDAKFGYARLKGGYNGFVIGPAMYYSLYSDTGFIKDFSIGAGLDFTMAKGNGVWAYSVLISPEARLEMPYSYAKLGFGYNYVRVGEIVAGAGATTGNLFGMKIGVGALFEVSEGMKMGLDFTFNYAFNKGNFGERLWQINVGPMVSFDL